MVDVRSSVYIFLEYGSMACEACLAVLMYETFTLANLLLHATRS